MTDASGDQFTGGGGGNGGGGGSFPWGFANSFVQPSNPIGTMKSAWSNTKQQHTATGPSGTVNGGVTITQNADGTMGVVGTGNLAGSATLPDFTKMDLTKPFTINGWTIACNADGSGGSMTKGNTKQTITIPSGTSNSQGVVQFDQMVDGQDQVDGYVSSPAQDVFDLAGLFICAVLLAIAACLLEVDAIVILVAIAIIVGVVGLVEWIIAHYGHAEQGLPA